MGSPPHVRGKPGWNRNADLLHGITPACAGKTLFCGCSLWLSQDHPRMCGENSPTLPSGSNVTGSPPHVRGKPFILNICGLFCGITPACAGKTNPAPVPEINFWDHPRMCGENDVRFLPVVACEGSPPHVRGKLCTWVDHDRIAGITPACAGKTPPNIFSSN